MLKELVARRLEALLLDEPLLDGYTGELVLHNQRYYVTAPETYYTAYVNAVLVVLFLGDHYFENDGTMQEWRRIIALGETRRHRVVVIYLGKRSKQLENTVSQVYRWFCGGRREPQWATDIQAAAERIAQHLLATWQTVTAEWSQPKHLHFLQFDGTATLLRRVTKYVGALQWSWRVVSDEVGKPREASVPQEMYCALAAERLAPDVIRRMALFASERRTRVRSTLEPLWITATAPVGGPSAARGWNEVHIDQLGGRLDELSALPRINVVCGEDLQDRLLAGFANIANLRIWRLSELHDSCDDSASDPNAYTFSALYERAADGAQNVVALTPGVVRDADALRSRIGAERLDVILGWLISGQPAWQIVHGTSRHLDRTERLRISPLPVAIDDSYPNAFQHIDAIVKEAQ